MEQPGGASQRQGHKQSPQGAVGAQLGGEAKGKAGAKVPGDSTGRR